MEILSPFAGIRALGEAGNLRAVEACTTRLRLVLNDLNRIDETALTALGSRGLLRLADGAVQVAVGPIADQLASEIRAQLRVPVAAKAVAAKVASQTSRGGSPVATPSLDIQPGTGR